jgi:DMSO/TMAO reductase YedYZ molybdopterin-dependent catalytic subunit
VHKPMKLNRRSFIKLIPAVALAIAGGSWWFLDQSTQESTMASQSSASSQAQQVTAATSETSQPSATTAVAPQTSLTTSETTQVSTATPEAFVFPITWNGDGPTKISPRDYRLKIDGDVQKPLTLTLEELYAMPSAQKDMKIICVEGWAADVLWEGIPLSYLLNQAGVSLKNTANVTVRGITGYERTLSSDEAGDSGTIIALNAGGIPLTIEHGYPARLVSPTRLGLDWVKYVTRITCKSK